MPSRWTLLTFLRRQGHFFDFYCFRNISPSFGCIKKKEGGEEEEERRAFGQRFMSFLLSFVNAFWILFFFDYSGFKRPFQFYDGEIRSIFIAFLILSIFSEKLLTVRIFANDLLIESRFSLHSQHLNKYDSLPMHLTQRLFPALKAIIFV